MLWKPAAAGAAKPAFGATDAHAGEPGWGMRPRC